MMMMLSFELILNSSDRVYIIVRLVTMLNNLTCNMYTLQFWCKIYFLFFLTFESCYSRNRIIDLYYNNHFFVKFFFFFHISYIYRHTRTFESINFMKMLYVCT